MQAKALFVLFALISMSACERGTSSIGDNMAAKGGGGIQPLIHRDSCITKFTSHMTKLSLRCEVAEDDLPGGLSPDAGAAGAPLGPDDVPGAVDNPETRSAAPLGDDDIPRNVTTVEDVRRQVCGVSAGPWPVEIGHFRECNGARRVLMYAAIGDEVLAWEWGGDVADKPDSVPDWNEPLTEVGMSCSPCGTPPPGDSTDSDTDGKTPI